MSFIRRFLGFVISESYFLTQLLASLPKEEPANAKEILIYRLLAFKPEAHISLEKGSIRLGDYTLYADETGHEMWTSEIWSPLKGELYILGSKGYVELYNKNGRKKLVIRPEKVEDIGEIVAIVKPRGKSLEVYMQKYLFS